MCPDWESNQRPFGLQARAQSTELHWPELETEIFLAAVLYTIVEVLSVSPRLDNYDYIHIYSELQGYPEAILFALIGHVSKK